MSSFIPLWLADFVFSFGRFYHKDAYNNKDIIDNFRMIQDEAVIPIIDSGADYVICGHLHKYISRKIVGENRCGELIVLPCWASGDYGIINDGILEIKNDAGG